MNKEFENILKSLGNWSGIKLFFLETHIGLINYNEVEKKFQRLVDYGGYRRYSQCGIKELTEREKEEIEYCVENNQFIFSEFDKFSQKRRIIYNGLDNYIDKYKERGLL